MIRSPDWGESGGEGGEIETGERMSSVGLLRLARLGSLITGGAPSSSELIFSIPPGGMWLLGGRGE